MTIREVFNAIKAVKAELAEQLEKINADVIHSGNYKLAQREEARESAKQRLEEINAEADEAIRALLEKTQEQDAFDYSDPRLLAAVQFIQANGNALPEAGWRQMVRDFEGRSKVLFYLSELFDSHGLVDAAIEANEAAKTAKMAESFPQRLGDAIFYATSADPEKSVDFRGYEAELSKIEAELSKIEADSEAGAAE